MGVFLTESVNYKELVSDNFTMNKIYNKCKINVDFNTKKIVSTNYLLSKKTHSNENLHGIILPTLFEVGSISYKDISCKILITNYNGFENPKDIPAGNPQYINGEFVILCLIHNFQVGYFVNLCLHEFGHIVTVVGKDNRAEELMKDLSNWTVSKESMYLSGKNEGLADSFMFAQIINKNDKKIFLEKMTKNGYYALFHGTDPKLEVYRKKIPHYKEYYKGYSSIIYTDIYSSPTVKQYM